MNEFIKNIDLQTISMQTLAFIGDAVYNVYIRVYLASQNNKKTGLLHRDSIKYVSAKGQSSTIDKIMDILSEEEIDKLCDLYKKETEKLNIDTEKRKNHIVQMLKELKEV